MISSDNLALNNSTNDEDFTYANYRELLKMAKSGWKIFDYRNIEWEEKFIVWRHDVDYSLNCSLKLAKIEQEERVKATYFINPHSEFYNTAEFSQHLLIKEILSLGHDIGLHFDAAFHEIKSESELNVLVTKESSYLEDLFGVKPTAFSFHNPVSENLECEADEYGGLKNCYSKRFKEEVGYCSDSNGYWRFRRLHEVLKEQKDPRLQVLTHPGWWQDEPAPPRQRIFRAAYGRAASTMCTYDRGLVDHHRINNVGEAQALVVLQELKPHEIELCDYLWSRGSFKTLFLKLWRLQEVQISQLCKVFLRKVWNITANEINRFFEDEALTVCGCDLFDSLFDEKFQEVAGTAKRDYEFWIKSRNELMIERSYLQAHDLEKGCVYLCSIIQQLAAWGTSQRFDYNGLADLDSFGFSENVSAQPKRENSQLKELDQLPEKVLQNWLAFNKKIKLI
jgi:hypothetical protein